MPRAIAYLRMSQGKGDDRDWKRRQLEDSRAIADRKGATLADEDVLIDTASASKFGKKQRTAYPELLRRIEAGGVDYVICWMEDRAHRQVLELAEFIELCRRHNTVPITPAAEYDLDDPDQVSMWFIKVRFAEAEVEKLSKRMRRQRLQAAQDGREHTGGLRRFGTTGQGKNKVSLARALAEQDMIREAAERIIAGDSLRGICVDWNKRKIRTAGNAKWNATILRRTLLAPRIAGYREHKGTLYPSKELPAIIPMEQWQTIHTILTDPARTTAVGGGQPKHLLSGLVHCGICGKRLYCRTPATKNGVRAYYCPDRDGVGGHVHRNAEKLENLIQDELFSAVEENQAFDDAAASLTEGDPTKVHYMMMAQLTANIDTFTDMETDYEREERQAREQGNTHQLDETRRKLVSIRKQLAQAEADRDEQIATITQLQGNRVMAHVPRNLRRVWPDLSLDRRRAILAAVFRGKQIVVYPQKHGSGPHFDPDAVRVVPIGQTRV